MIKFNWNGHGFKVIEYGEGVFEKDMAGHSHAANSYELHYITGGEGTLVTDNNSYALEVGCFFVAGPNIYHKHLTNTENPLTEICIYLQSSERKINNSIVSAFLNTHFYFCRNEDLGRYFEIIRDEKKRKQIGSESIISGIVQVLMTEITRLYIPEGTELPINEENININDKRFLIIENEFIFNAENLTLSSLADSIGLCVRQTQRLLKKYYGKSFKEKKSEAKKK